MTRIRQLLLIACLSAAAPARAAEDPLAQARALLAKSPVIDGHIDVPEQLRVQRQNRLQGFDYTGVSGPLKGFHTDLKRLKAGGIGGVFWSVYVDANLAPDEAVRQTIEQIDVMKRLIALYPGQMAQVGTAAEMRAAIKAGKVGGFFGAEGGHSINNSLGVLRQLYALGVRYMTLTHFRNNDWADSATDAPKHGGLTPFGVEVVREMNRLGMLVDISHVAETTMLAAIDASAAPVIFSHSEARAIAGHPRNASDAVLKRLSANGGVMMVNFAQPYLSDTVWRWNQDLAAEEARLKAALIGHSQADLNAGVKAWEAAHPAPRATVKDVADHIDHIRQVAGIDHIGIGSDFDGLPDLPVGLGGADELPRLFAELIRRGYSDADLAKIAQGNILRVLAQAEQVATHLQRERPPGETAIPAGKP
ncbi:MAG: dipeptidase [Sphingomonadaceae bacterium]|nr:dipeptidase [Sphingomonadaceae bacterium]